MPALQLKGVLSPVMLQYEPNEQLNGELKPDAGQNAEMGHTVLADEPDAQ